MKETRIDRVGIEKAGAQLAAGGTAFGVIVAISFCHLLNDVMQSLLASLDSHPNIEVRVFNPVPSWRGTWLGYHLALVADFDGRGYGDLKGAVAEGRLDVHVGADGTVLDVKVRASSGSRC